MISTAVEKSIYSLTVMIVSTQSLITTSTQNIAKTKLNFTFVLILSKRQIIIYYSPCQSYRAKTYKPDSFIMSTEDKNLETTQEETVATEVVETPTPISLMDLYLFQNLETCQILRSAMKYLYT